MTVKKQKKPKLIDTEQNSGCQRGRRWEKDKESKGGQIYGNGRKLDFRW